MKTLFIFLLKPHTPHGTILQIDVSFRELILTNMKCSKISPFVCGNISTNSVAKKYRYIFYPYHSLNLARTQKKLNFFIRFYYYSASNIKVKFGKELPSSPPCLFFVQRTGRKLFFTLTDGPPARAYPESPKQRSL